MQVYSTSLVLANKFFLQSRIKYCIFFMVMNMYPPVGVATKSFGRSPRRTTISDEKTASDFLEAVFWRSEKISQFGSKVTASKILSRRSLDLEK